MEGNNNWPNYPRNNPPRGRPFNNRGVPRPNVNRGNPGADNNLPPPYASSGNRQNNPHNFSNNAEPTYSREGQHNSYPKYFKTKSFPQNRPGPYNRPHNSKHPYQRNRSCPRSNDLCESEPSAALTKELSPLEIKIEKLLNAVRSQDGITAELVFLQAEFENPTVVLQNAVQGFKNGVLAVKPKGESQIFELSINGEKMAEGAFQNKQLAKNSLCETVFNDLKKKCFYIIKKKNYEEISTDDISNAKKEILPPSTMEGSKAHLMMLKMGWGGKGLGSNEQGVEKTVAETLIQNVTKAGLGGKNVMNEIHDILEKFAGSAKVTTLAFDSGFTKEERAHIHKMAGKFNLKSKSEGKDDNRRITISKKIAKWDLVKELLLVNCENDSYKLIIPSEFEGFWTNE